MDDSTKKKRSVRPELSDYSSGLDFSRIKDFFKNKKGDKKDKEKDTNKNSDKKSIKNIQIPEFLRNVNLLDYINIPEKNPRKRRIYYLSFFLFPMVFLYYEILFKIYGGISPGNALAMLFFTLTASFLFSAVSFAIPKKQIRLIYSEIVIAVTAILFITQAFVGRVFQTFMTFESLLSAAGDAAGDFGGEIVTTIFTGWYLILLYLLPSILVPIFRKKLFIRYRRKSSMKRAICYGVAAFLLAQLFAIWSPVYRQDYQYDLSMRKLGVFATFYNDIRHSGSSNSLIVTDDSSGILSVDKENEDEDIVYDPNVMDIDFEALAASASDDTLKNLYTYLASQSGSSQNKYTGLFKDKNLIFITAEAFSGFAVDEELTPTLYRMMHNGFYFSDYYQPAWGGSTSTGEFSNLMGTIPTDGVHSIRNTEGHNMYLTIGSQHSRQGYYTAAYHNNSYTYYSRNLTHENLGYSIFMGYGNGMEEGVTKAWPQSDLEMIDYTVPMYIDKQPFSIYYMSVSGHCGYSTTGNAMSKKNWDAVQSMEGASDTVKAYQASQMELEYAMASLIKQLETAGILDDTVIVIASDHYPYGLEEGETWHNEINYLPELYGVAESEITPFVRDQNALIIWSGCLENDLENYAVEVDYPVYSLDILPTLCNLFGLDYDSRLFAGRDVFSDEIPLVIWGNYSWKTDKALYDASTGEMTPLTDEEVTDEYVTAVKNLVRNKFALSHATLDYDFWGLIFQSPATEGAEAARIEMEKKFEKSNAKVRENIANAKAEAEAAAQAESEPSDEE